jgi:hypothetical protein
MKISRIFWLARFAAIISFSLLAGQVQAALWTVTTSGTIYSGFDKAGYFGAVNSDLRGLSYTQSVTLDPLQYSTVSRQAFFQTGFGTISAAKVTVSVNGVSRSFLLDPTKDNDGRASLLAASNQERVVMNQYGYQADGEFFGSFLDFNSYDYKFLNGVGFDQVVSYDAQPGDDGYYYFSAGRGAPGEVVDTFWDANVTNISINAADVPEPASAALFALGLLAFAAARRKVS